MTTWLPRFETFCFCMSLMTGCCIIGHLETLFGIATIVQDLVILEEAAPEQDSVVMYYAFLSDLLLSSIQVVTGIVLIVGVKTRSKDHLKIWIQVHIFLFWFVVVGYIMSVVIVPFTNEMINVAMFEMLILLYTLRSLLVYGFCIITVNSLYMQLYHSDS